MNAAWFAFAENPIAPGKPWIAYDGQGKVVQWSGDGVGAADLDRPASCSAIWLHALPYRATASSPRR